VLRVLHEALLASLFEFALRDLLVVVRIGQLEIDDMPDGVIF
jgi:hypothetical protein